MSILNISGYDQAKKLTSRTFSYEVMAFGLKNDDNHPLVSADSLVRYHPIQNHYTVEVEPNSAFGYFAFISKLFFLALGIGVLWNFKKIFRETNLNHPFRASIARRLKILAALFIINEVLKIIEYISFNSFLHHSVSAPHMQLLTTIGNGIIIGLIVYVISIIYQRGTALEEETSLTV